ncbi:hypothetical protein TSOC_007836 [Tetrabaena socialis]|uniref:Uncharacterized protein n=1 Tax=Tetrabaena socialis TaxID=47790 RepID=A0A2J8A024_9CHLO|nr:hypothetical protein TSOC_007836 [Tetrabaena socialis]|eukprot:PNH05870.1 hypothetical protein TSOC_007836 [Tetrabaena socialis]
MLAPFISGMMPTPATASALRSLTAALPATDVLLCGPSASGRSSLALHFALYHAARSMLPAMFLCRQEALEQAVPMLPYNCSGDDPSLHLLHIKYLVNHVDLQRFAACLHLLRGAYSAIVVEDLAGLVRTDDRNALVRTVAMLVEGVRSYRAAGVGGSRCALLVTDSSDEARRPRYIHDRWFPATLVLAPDSLQGGHEGSYTISAVAPSCAGQHHGPARAPRGSDAAEAQHQAPSSVQCSYRAADGHLVLEALHGLGPAPPDGAGGPVAWP